jgi:ubiquinone/menaquinone biosynthesis C-methylase UbiE
VDFSVPAEHYDRFMGRYSAPLAVELADAAEIATGMRVLDVGCGPGSLTRVLADRLGAEHVAGADPMEQFAAVCAERNPGVDVRVAPAEDLPFEDGAFDAALACLVIAFMRDPDAGVREMARVTRPGGVIATCMWDVPGGGMTMLSTYWRAAAAVVPGTQGERALAGVTEGDIAERFERAGLEDVRAGSLRSAASYEGFDDFWLPFTFGVGPAGQHLGTLAPEQQQAVRQECFRLLGEPAGPFELEARAWYARGTVPAG